MSTYVLCIGSSAACEKVMLADTTIEDKRKGNKIMFNEHVPRMSHNCNGFFKIELLFLTNLSQAHKTGNKRWTSHP